MNCYVLVFRRMSIVVVITFMIIAKLKPLRRLEIIAFFQNDFYNQSLKRKLSLCKIKMRSQIEMFGLT